MTDYEKGIELLRTGKWREAVATFAKGDDDACRCQLALCYLNARGVEQNVQKAVELLNTCYENRYTDAYLHLSRLYDKGIGVLPDHAKALSLCKEAAELGNKQAMVQWGQRCLDDVSVRDPKLALYWLNKAKDLDSSAAMNTLGVLYMAGEVVPRDPMKAKEMFERGTALGDAECIYNLSLTYFDGSCGQKDLLVSCQLMRKSAEMGFAPAFHSLGLRYLNGWGVARDEKEAKKWFYKSACAEVPDGMNLYGTMLLQGRGGAERDPASAILWFEKAAGRLHGGAMNNLGICALNGFTKPADPMLARNYFVKAAERNNPDGFFNLGMCYYEGTGGEQNYARAYDLFDKAARAGHASAPTFVAVCLCYGTGVKADPEKGYAMLAKMADRGEMNALYYRARCLREGIGVAKNDEAAEQMMRRAAKMGKPKAQEELNRWQAERGSLVEQANKAYDDKDYAKAQRLYIECADKGNADAMCRLGQMLMEGKGSPVDDVTAAVWLERALSAGNVSSSYYLGELLWEGRGTPKNQKRAMGLWNQCALLGMKEAQVALALAYRTGSTENKPDMQACAMWAKRAAEAGSKEGCRILADCYRRGEGVERNEALAEEWENNAAAR